MSLRTCILTATEFEISDLEEDYCSRYDVPLPLMSPAERLRNMLVFRNRVYLYPSRCHVSGKNTLSCYPPESGVKSCDPDVWHSDRVDNRVLGREYDFSRPFFDQFFEVYREAAVPGLAVIAPLMENSEFTNGITGAKNCYLVFSASYNEDCLFSHSLWRSRNIVDSLFVRDSELCYGCVDITECYNLKWSRHCRNCTDATFLLNCQACSDCYGCANLNHKRFHFFNEPLEETEYRRRVSQIDLGSTAVLEREQERFSAFSAAFPFRSYFGSQNENSSGNYIFHDKGCRNCRFVTNSEDLVESIFLDAAKNSILHAMFGNNSELIYNSATVGDNAYNIRFCFECWQNVSDLEYCCNCSYGTTNCLGCAGLTRASYCILNKQYSKDEYFSLVPRIKKQMIQNGEYGRFFPPSFSPFYYNESDVMFFFPLEAGEAAEWGFKWKTEQAAAVENPRTVPDHIDDTGDELIGETFICRESGKPYRLIKQELQFYRANRIPPPRIAPLVRIRSRMNFFEMRPAGKRRCEECGKDVETVFSKLPRPILCEECFRRAVY